MAGGFQKPRVDPGCLNAPEQEGCNVSLGSEVFYPSELELQTVPSQLWVPCTPQLSCAHDKTGTAHAALCSPTGAAKAEASSSAVKMEPNSLAGTKVPSKIHPLQPVRAAQALRGCSMLHSASARGWIAGESFFILSTVKPSPSLKLCSLLSLFYCSN